MTTTYEWHSTTHPFFSVSLELASEIDDEGEHNSDERVLVIRTDQAAVIQGDLEVFARAVADAVYIHRPAQSERDPDDVYLARVIEQGRLLGVSWLTIAQRIIALDLPGMGYRKVTDDAGA
jgi:hypothetical protein